ncbi:Os09g0446350, partial [Oryza sativa Japonica Group]
SVAVVVVGGGDGTASWSVSVGGDHGGAVSSVRIGTLRRQTGQVFRSDSHCAMQWAWYRWPHGSLDAGDASWRASVQTAQAAAAAASSETVTVITVASAGRDDDGPDTKEESWMEDVGGPPACGGVSGSEEMK